MSQNDKQHTITINKNNNKRRCTWTSIYITQAVHPGTVERILSTVPGAPKQRR